MRINVIDSIAKTAWIGRGADAIVGAVKQAYTSAGTRGLRIKSALNGVWLGHPLHPALTDVPLGAWTAAMAFDAAHAVSRNDELGSCSRAAILVGVAGAIVSAATGVTDWSDTDGRARRIGLVHGALNLTATCLFATSLVQRKGRPHQGGRLCSTIGYAIALGAAYLGGGLVYDEQIGVNHAAGQEVPEEFTSVLALSDLPEDQPKRVIVGTTPVLLVRHGETVRAIAETCSHLGGPLSEGTLKDGAIVCPWHASCFSLDDGHVVNGPSTHPQPCFEAHIRGDQIEVRMPQTPARRAVEETKTKNMVTDWRTAS